MKRAVLVLCCIGLLWASAAHAAYIDLTAIGGEGSAGDLGTAYFVLTKPNPIVSGTGQFPSFSQVGHQVPQPPNDTERGYNYGDSGNREFNSGTSGQHNYLIQRKDVSIVTDPYNETGDFYLFLLDINEKNSDPARYLSVDDVEIWMSDSAELGNPNDGGTDRRYGTAGWSSVATKVYDLELTPGTTDLTNNWLAMNFDLDNGSGKEDMAMFIPTALMANGYTGNTYIYLYSQFGLKDDTSVDGLAVGDGIQGWGASDGFEEWAIERAAIVPEPASCALLVLAIGGVGATLKRRRKV